MIDRGRAAVYPLVDKIVAVRKAHKLLIGTGAGTRARHFYPITAGSGCRPACCRSSAPQWPTSMRGEHVGTIIRTGARPA